MMNNTNERIPNANSPNSFTNEQRTIIESFTDEQRTVIETVLLEREESVRAEVHRAVREREREEVARRENEANRNANQARIEELENRINNALNLRTTNEKEALKKEESRKSIKPPDVFKSNKNESENFMDKLEMYLKSRPTIYEKESDKIDLAISYLDGDSYAWAMRLYKDGKINSFAEFKEAFEDKYKDFDAKERAQNKIKTMKQGKGSVSSYLVRFEKYQKASEYGEEALFTCFKDGLSPEVRRGLLGQAKNNFTEYTKLAVSLGNEIHLYKMEYDGNGKKDRYSKNNDRITERYQPPTEGVTPMELDQVSVKKLQKQINQLQAQIKNSQPSNGGNSTSGTISGKGRYAGRTHSVCKKCGKWSLHVESECKAGSDKSFDKTMVNQEVQVSDDDSEDDKYEEPEEDFQDQ